MRILEKINQAKSIVNSLESATATIQCIWRNNGKKAKFTINSNGFLDVQIGSVCYEINFIGEAGVIITVAENNLDVNADIVLLGHEFDSIEDIKISIH